MLKYKNISLSTVLVSCLTFMSSSFAVLINEFQPNPAGGDPDNQIIELIGEANTSQSGYFIQVDADGTQSGRIDDLISFTANFNAEGLYTFEVPDLENPSATYLLVDQFEEALSFDFDIDNDGFLDDLSVFNTVYDAVTIVDSPSDQGFASMVGGINLQFIGSEPTHVFRDSVSMEWIQVNSSSNLFDRNANAIEASAFNLPIEVSFESTNPTIQTAEAPIGSTLYLMSCFILSFLLLQHIGRNITSK